MLIVKKFGGSSVANRERIENVAERCIEDYRRGAQVVVVLSAMGDSTDRLINLAKSIHPNPPKREMDMLLATGEQTSVALMSMAIAARGISAISLNAFQVAMHTTSVYSDARFKRIDTERINNELDSGKIVIVTGFQGINRREDMTTLGRGGSDTTAVALAAALHADACEIYTDVEGVYTADPRIVENSQKLKEITYDEMLELATLGAKVLHNRSVELAKKFGVELVVRSSMNKARGTTVKEVTKVEGMLVSGVAVDKNAARIAVLRVKNEPGIAFRIFDALARANINIDMILQSIGRDNTKDISFTVDKEQADEATRILMDNKERLTIDEIKEEKGVAKLSVVGAGMQTNAGVAAKMFEALYDVGINIRMISTSEIRISVLISEEDSDRAMRAVHSKFFN